MIMLLTSVSFSFILNDLKFCKSLFVVSIYFGNSLIPYLLSILLLRSLSFTDLKWAPQSLTKQRMMRKVRSLPAVGQRLLILPVDLGSNTWFASFNITSV